MSQGFVWSTPIYFFLRKFLIRFFYSGSIAETTTLNSFSSPVSFYNCSSFYFLFVVFIFWALMPWRPSVGSWTAGKSFHSASTVRMVLASPHTKPCLSAPLTLWRIRALLSCEFRKCSCGKHTLQQQHKSILESLAEARFKGTCGSLETSGCLCNGSAWHVLSLSLFGKEFRHMLAPDFNSQLIAVHRTDSQRVS